MKISTCLDKNLGYWMESLFHFFKSDHNNIAREWLRFGGRDGSGIDAKFEQLATYATEQWNERNIATLSAYYMSLKDVLQKF